MENGFFSNAGIIPPPPLVFEQAQPSSSSIPTWKSISSAMEFPTDQYVQSSQDYFMNPNWEKSTTQNGNFDSSLSSLVSSPTASNESFVMRELIGKMGCIGNSEISPPMVDHFVKDKIPKSCPLSSSSLPEFSADPGFAERAARFSCYGSKSFNGRTTNNNTHFFTNNTELIANRSNPLMAIITKLPRVSSTPSMNENIGSLNNSLLPNQSESRHSQEESTVSEQIPAVNHGLKITHELNSRKRKSVSKGKSTAAINGSSKVIEDKDDLHSKRIKPTETNNSKVKTEEEGDKREEEVHTAKPVEPVKDYIHVRARRGQATDSHSLAERVRREKISERMKLLQDLVPGCNKVTGKALMLDEIINYVQSLQRQVEFLSMKLASVNTRLDFNVDSLMSKDIIQPNNSIFPLDTSATAFFNHQNPAIDSNISSGTMDPINSSLNKNIIHSLQQFTHNLHQFPNLCTDDLQTIVQMGLSQNSIGDIMLHPGLNQSSGLNQEQL